MKFKNLKIGKKLTVSFAAVIIIFMAFSGYQMLMLKNLSHLQDQGASRADDGIYISGNASVAVKTYKVLADAIINKEKAVTDKAWEEITDHADEIFIHLEKIIDTAEEEALLNKARKDYEDLAHIFEDKIYPLLFELQTIDENDIEAKIHQLDGEADKLVNEIEESLAGILTSLHDEMVEADHVYDQKAGTIIITNMIVILVILLIAITFIYILVNLITKPLQKGVAFAVEVSRGNLMATVDIDQEDEVGDLANALRKMIGKIRNIVQEISSGSENILLASQEVSTASQQMSSHSQQLTSNTQQLSQGATEQASSTEEISASMEEMVANIQQNTENAQQTEKIAEKVSKNISIVRDRSQKSVEQINRIAEKIGIIGEIANQTNILALNAAVEAARAGEHGKGFAVVAAEVRKLAERSKIAADEINELSKSSVNVTEEAGCKLEEVIPDIQRTAQLVQEITAASLEQNSGAEQVNTSIQQLNQITQGTASGSEQMASSAEELSSTSEELATNAEEMASQAEHLRSVIAFFKTDDNSYYNQARVSQPVNLKRTIQSRQKPATQKTTNSSKHGTWEYASKNEGKKGVDLKMSEENDDQDKEFEKY